MESLFKPIGELTYEQLRKQERLLVNMLIDTRDRMKQIESNEGQNHNNDYFNSSIIDLNS